MAGYKIIYFQNGSLLPTQAESVEGDPVDSEVIIQLHLRWAELVTNPKT